MNIAALPAPDSSQLVVVDIQEKLAAAMPAKYLQGNLTRAGKLVKAAIGLGLPVTITEQYRKGLGATLPVVMNEIPSGAAPIDKVHFDCCQVPEFTTTLADAASRKDVILIGMETHICVLQTSLSLAAGGFRPWIVEDACLSRYDEDHRSAICLLRSQGIAVASFETILYGWIRQAATPEFKNLSYLSRERDY